MSRYFKAVCPFCGTEVRSSTAAQGIVTIQCPQCVSSFKIKAPAASSSGLIPVPALPPASSVQETAGISTVRLAVVLGGALLYLAGGAALMAYCLQRNAHNDSAPRTGASTG